MFLLLLLFVVRSDAQAARNCTVGSHCFIPKTTWQSDGTCINDETRGAHICHIPLSRSFKFTLQISVRRLKIRSKKAKSLDNLWIRGIGPGLDWDEPIMLQKSAKGIGLWVTDISYQYDSKAQTCPDRKHCSPDQRNMEFRVYQDSGGEDDMLGPNLYVDLPVSHSMFGHQHFISPTVNVHPWFSGKAVTVEELFLTNMPPPFKTVRAELLYPPSYDYNVRRKYPVIVLLGAREEGLRISPLLETMFVHEASIREAFLIHIQINDSAPFCDLNPYSVANAGSVNSIWKCKHEEHCEIFNFCWFSWCDKDTFVEGTKQFLHAVKCGGRGEAMLDVIEKYLIPSVESKIQNRLLLDFPVDRLSIIGFDGAGLLACHAAVSRPQVYQNAACMSAPFHWPLNVALFREDMPVDGTGISKVLKDTRRQFVTYPNRRFFYSTQKYYIDYGAVDNFHFPLINPAPYVDWFVERLKVEFAVPSQNIMLFRNLMHSGNNYFLHTSGGTEILNRIKMPLLFFLRTKGGPNAAFPDLTEPTVSNTEPEETEEEDEAIPQDCIHELQLYQRVRALASKGIPVAVVALSVSELCANIN